MAVDKKYDLFGKADESIRKILNEVKSITLNRKEIIVFLGYIMKQIDLFFLASNIDTYINWYGCLPENISELEDINE